MEANEEANKNVKIAADVRQKERAECKKQYTCDKNKMRFLEVNLDENKHVLNPFGFHTFFENERKLCFSDRRAEICC